MTGDRRGRDRESVVRNAALGLAALSLLGAGAGLAAETPKPATGSSSTRIEVRKTPRGGVAVPAKGTAESKSTSLTDGRPGDPRYSQLLRSAARQASQGQHLAASRTYEQVLGIWPHDLDATRGLGDALAALGRYDEAEKVLNDYRKAKGPDAGVARSLASVHRAQERYDAYLADVLSALSEPGPGQVPPVSWALRALEEIAAQPSTATKVEPAVRQLLKEHPEVAELRLLLADQLLRQGNEAGALAEVEAADRDSKAGGRILAQYGEELEAAGKMGLAEQALRKSAEATTDAEDRLAAYTRLAEFAERQNRPAVEAEAWKAVAAAGPKSPAGLAALESLARVQLYRLNDQAGALETLTALEARPDIGERKHELYLPIAECQVRMGSHDDALQTLEKLKGSMADAETQAEGAFLGAEIRFFRADFDAAQVEYENVAQNFTRTRKTNDAVGRYLQIAWAKDQKDLAALAAYARMEEAHRMGDSTATWQAAQSLIAEHAASNFAADALVRQAELLRPRPGKTEEAIALCTRAADTYPKARAAAYALAVMGDICLKDLGDRKRALAAYERLLDEHPQNLLAAEVRRTVERLRRGSES
jgi:thioredoxin-like negative regulator of GroEL